MKRLVLALFLIMVCSMPAAAQQMRPADFEKMLVSALRNNPELMSEALSTEQGQKVFADMLRRVFKENPDLVLEVLKAHEDLVFSYAQNGATAQKRRAMNARWVEDAKNPKKINLKAHPVRGKNNAPVTLVVYSDFTCGYCKQASKVIASLQKKIPGTFQYVFKPRPAKNPAALMAAQWFIAAAMQDQEKAWALYTILFNEQSALSENPAAFLNKAAQQVGLNVELLQSEAQSRKVSDLIAADLEEAKALGVSGTPYLFVDDLVIPGAPDENLLRSAVEQAKRLKEKK